MPPRHAIVALGLLLAVPSSARAGGRTARIDAPTVKALVKDAHQQRLASLRDKARFFSKITQQKDWSGEHVVHHDAHVTAFLDLSDPAHPRNTPEIVDEDEHIQTIPRARRAHVLVIPNQMREHIGKSVSGTITLEDLEATKGVLESATRVARDLGIRNPRIFINTADRLTVGYLHAHIIGERDGRPYPQVTGPAR